MKTKFLALAGLLALTISCTDDSVDGECTIEQGQSVTINKADGAILTVNTIQNSLCPPNVVCFRGGEVLVNVTATQSGNTTTTTLCMGPDCQTLQNGKTAKQTISVGSHTWTVELINALRTTPEKAILKVDVR